MRVPSWTFGAVCALFSASFALCGVPEAEFVLEVSGPPAPGYAPEAAPPRFAMLRNGQVFVGGTSEILTSRLERKERRKLQKQVDRVRKLRGLASEVVLGPGEVRYKLYLRKSGTLMARGDLTEVPARLRPLGQLIESVLCFDLPTLRPYRPSRYRLAVRAGTLRGGCRSWNFALPLIDALPAPRVVPAEMAAGWPTGAAPASVCHRGKQYVVTLRPLLPGENP
jgi:hypothetical protein